MAERLPIYEIEDEILRGIRGVSRLLIQAPTGSGKSTQVPQMLFREKSLIPGEIVILQPRRLAARMLASRVAFEMGCKIGEEVGYQIRFESRECL